MATTTNVKLTKKDYFNAIRDMILAETNDLTTNCEFLTIDANAVIDFIDNEIDLLSRRNSTSKKPSSTQVENEGIKQNILNALQTVNKPITISELMEQDNYFAQFQNQKLSALMRQLILDNKIVKTVIKKKSYFAIAQTETVTTETTTVDNSVENDNSNDVIEATA